MESFKGQNLSKRPFPIPNYRFDKKNEIFKRKCWDERIAEDLRSQSKDIRYLKKVCYSKTDFAFRNAAWSPEHNFARGQRGRVTINMTCGGHRRSVWIPPDLIMGKPGVYSQSHLPYS